MKKDELYKIRSGSGTDAWVGDAISTDAVCVICGKMVQVTSWEMLLKDYAHLNLQHEVSENVCWHSYTKHKAEELGLGKNFQLYPNTTTLPWVIGSCSWKEFSPQHLGDLTMRQLQKGEEEKVAKVWAAGFPELFLGTYGFVLDPKDYDIFFGEEWRMFVFQTAEESIAGAWILRLDEANLSADFTLVVVHPNFRGQGLLKASSAVLDKHLDDCGVELAIVSCATFHLATRKVFRQLGFTPIGIMRGAVRANVSGQFYRRDSVELLQKLYRNAAMLVPPVEKEEGL